MLKTIHKTCKELSGLYDREYNIPKLLAYPIWLIVFLIVFTVIFIKYIIMLLYNGLRKHKTNG